MLAPAENQTGNVFGFELNLPRKNVVFVFFLVVFIATKTLATIATRQVETTKP